MPGANDRPASGRWLNQALLKEIEAVHEESKETYGSPRIYHALKEKIPCSENRVARLMRRHGIAAKQRKRYKQTTKANAAHPVTPNLLDGDFTATAPN